MNANGNEEDIAENELREEESNTGVSKNKKSKSIDKTNEHQHKSSNPREMSSVSESDSSEQSPSSSQMSDSSPSESDMESDDHSEHSHNIKRRRKLMSNDVYHEEMRETDATDLMNPQMLSEMKNSMRVTMKTEMGSFFKTNI